MPRRTLRNMPAMHTPPAPGLLSGEHIALIAKGVSAIVAACDAGLRPSVMRAVGSTVSPDGACITVYLMRQQSGQLLQDISRSGRLAVVFSEPSTHRTLQVKADSVQARPAHESDLPVLRRYRESMERELGLIGFAPQFVRAMLAFRPQDLVALSFAPREAYDQTPGPRAGMALAGPAGSLPEVAAAPAVTEPSALEAGTWPRSGVVLGAIRPCLEGAIPAMMATCARDGTPNVAYLSQVYHVDEQHVALSFQFFNKTRQNILAHPLACVLVLHPATAQFYRLHLRYLRTETTGAVFEAMKAQLAGIASHSGMADVFTLRGSDIYAVLAIESIDGEPLPAPPARCGMLGAVRCCSERLARAGTMDELLQAVLASLTDGLDVRHAMVLMLDEAAQRLYTVASCGYATSGLGSEIAVGDGVIGVAARERTPVRILHMTTAYLYSSAVRSSLRADAPDLELGTDIPYPGLALPHSQLAVPILAAGRLLGVLFVESPQAQQFSYEDEDVMVAIAGHLGATLALAQAAGEQAEAAPAAVVAAPAAPSGATLVVRRYTANDSIFVNDAYLIKGVAGAIFWKLVRDYSQQGRTEFTNRELRLDGALGLPDITDNLEARLLLLQRRLAEQARGVHIEKTGRGRFRLVVQRPLDLVEVP